jgi:hypothetical protein
VRGPARRQGERRQPGFAARRGEDAELNRQRRAFRAEWLPLLPRDTLRLWIDGLWLGRASDADLTLPVNAVWADLRARTSVTPPKKGRPRRPLDASLRWHWHTLQLELQEFSRLRRQHHARANRSRQFGTQKSPAFRDAALASWIGMIVQEADLFTAFFDETTLTPQEMAARLLLHHGHRRLKLAEEHAYTEAQHAMSPDSRELWSHWATRIAEGVVDSRETGGRSLTDSRRATSRREFPTNKSLPSDEFPGR